MAPKKPTEGRVVNTTRRTPTAGRNAPPQPLDQSTPVHLNPMREIGVGGVRQYAGYIRADFIPELDGTKGAAIFREMADNDALLGGIIFAVTMLLRTAEWRVEAADDSAEAKKQRDWLEKELMQTMSTPWPEVMADACSMAVYGYAPCEIVWAKRDDGSIGVAKIALRAQVTVERWQFDPVTGELLGLLQRNPNTGELIFIPRDRFCLFRTEASRGNPQGRSMLRTSFVYYVRKKVIEEAEGRAAIRSGGLVVIEAPAEIMRIDADDEQKAMFSVLKQLADDLAADKKGSVILPKMLAADGVTPMLTLSYLVADGRRPADMTNIIERMDKRMASSVLADFMLLGQQAVGSFALASSKTNLFAVAIGGILDIIRQELVRMVLMPLWAMNGWDMKVMPKLIPGDLETVDLTALSAFITALVGASADLSDEDTINYLRKQAGMPQAKPGKAAVKLIPGAVPPGGAKPKPPKPGEDGGPIKRGNPAVGGVAPTKKKTAAA